YDTYPAGLNENLSGADLALQRLVNTISRPDISLDDIFHELFHLLATRPDDPVINQFPGPFIRKVLRLLDRRGMEGVRCFSAISQTVRDRQDYFPPAAAVQVIHHPSNLNGLRSGGRDYLFTASRLDGPKRIDLLLRAFLRTRLDLPFLIAGTGPREAELKELAGGDPRVRFLGFVSDRDLAGYYADAAAVLYAPDDEDYGLITVEALTAGKPVITCTDAGGVTELVVDGENGLVARPAADSLAAAIERVPELLTAETAAGCRASVADISWQRLMSCLLADADSTGTGQGASPGGRRHTLVVSTYPVFPPVAGGQLRLYHILRRLACRDRVSLLSLGGDTAAEHTITPYFTEQVIPETASFAEAKAQVEARLGISAADIAFMLHDAELPAFEARFCQLAASADRVICAQPYAFPLVKRHFRGSVVYDAHNVEYLLKAGIARAHDKELLQALFDVEKELCQTAELTLACTIEDIEAFREVYGLADFRHRLVPNGVDAGHVPFLSPAERARCKLQLGIKEPLAIFIGSCHPPNIDAVEALLSIAGELPEMRFVILGSVANAFDPGRLVEDEAQPEIPPNVGFTGLVPEAEKALYLMLADIALNPMRSGSGSNLKLAEYLAAGLPVVSTPVGARGYQLIPAELMIRAEIFEFPSRILSCLADRDEARLLQTRSKVIENYSWDSIVREISRL
ncbi:MAG TPA: glycosyltransferase family 4 protein, partial [Desulfuromonadales bacterium]|nr:glycosyltransferase family 4 protein [Desulfuromonadales bacterium]